MAAQANGVGAAVGALVFAVAGLLRPERCVDGLHLSGCTVILRLLQAEAIYDGLLLPYRVRADHIMVRMNLFLLLVCMALAPWRSTYAVVALVGLPTLGLAYVLARGWPGQLVTRIFMGCAFMAYTGIIIHQSGGDIEAHFAAFGLIGVLLYYRDWRSIVAATVFIYLHHLVLGYAQTLGVPVYVFDQPNFWVLFGVHVAYFLPFIAMMVYLSIWLRREGYEAQHVIVLAQQVVQGNLMDDGASSALLAHAKMPLVAAVQQMKQRLLDLLKVLPVAAAVVRIDTGAIVSINEAWERRIGPLGGKDERIGESPIWVDPATWSDLIDRMHSAAEKLINKTEVVLRKNDGTPMICELSIVLHEGVTPVMAILTVEDITLRRRAEETMKRLAFRDALTQLPNRASLQLALEQAMHARDQKGQASALVMLDLDGFKPINDQYGHDAGDEVLRAIGARLQWLNERADVAARLGGDEFCVVLGSGITAPEALATAEQVIEAVAQPIQLNAQAGVWVRVGASAGVACLSPNLHNIEAWLKRADEALYQAKRSGKNRVCVAPECQMD